MPTAQGGMGEGGKRAVEEELLAPFRESLRELSEDQPEQLSVPLMGGKEGGEPEEEGGTTPGNVVNDVHGCSHARAESGAEAPISVGPDGKEEGEDRFMIEEAAEGGEGCVEREGLFGPLSPREAPPGGLLLLGRQLESERSRLQDGTEPISESAADGIEGGPDETEDKFAAPPDPLTSFLISCSAPPPTALLPTPAGSGRRKEGQADPLSRRSNGRLAAKPTAGWSTMDKVKMVLLKKSGIWEEGSPQVAASAADLQRYRELYKEPLPGGFIAAIESLVEAAGKRKGKETCGTGQAICV